MAIPGRKNTRTNASGACHAEQAIMWGKGHAYLKILSSKLMPDRDRPGSSNFPILKCPLGWQPQFALCGHRGCRSCTLWLCRAVTPPKSDCCSRLTPVVERGVGVVGLANKDEVQSRGAGRVGKRVGGRKCSSPGRTARRGAYWAVFFSSQPH